MVFESNEKDSKNFDNSIIINDQSELKLPNILNQGIVQDPGELIIRTFGDLGGSPAKPKSNKESSPDLARSESFDSKIKEWQKVKRKLDMEKSLYQNGMSSYTYK